MVKYPVITVLIYTDYIYLYLSKYTFLHFLIYKRYYFKYDIIVLFCYYPSNSL